MTTYLLTYGWTYRQFYTVIHSCTVYLQAEFRAEEVVTFIAGEEIGAKYKLRKSYSLPTPGKVCKKYSLHFFFTTPDT